MAVMQISADRVWMQIIALCKSLQIITEFEYKSLPLTSVNIAYSI
jgi:hypothetical protein